MFLGQGANTFFCTPRRKQEGSVLVVGTNILPSLMIPPNQEEFTLSGHCSSEYTKEFFPEDGLNVVIVNMHSHLAGETNSNFLSIIHERTPSIIPILLMQRSRIESPPLQRWEGAAMALE